MKFQQPSNCFYIIVPRDMDTKRGSLLETKILLRGDYSSDPTDELESPGHCQVRGLYLKDHGTLSSKFLKNGTINIRRQQKRCHSLLVRQHRG